MTKNQTVAVYNHWASALKACLAEGIPHNEVVPAFLHLSAGCVQGLVGEQTAREQILRLRDEVHAQMTQLADRK